MSGNEYYLVPRVVSTFFTGRVEIGERIEKAFFTADSDTQRRYVITGMGGTGKSEVCLKFVDTHRQNFWAIFWIDCSKPSVAEQEFVHLARKCDAVVDTFEDAKLWLARAKRRWLLILDNADDPDFDYSQYFPLSSKGSILITSRIPECCVHQTAGHENLGGLELLDAKELLLKSAGFELDTSSENQLKAMEIVQVLGSHTLALTQAGAAVRNHFCPLNGYTLLFKRHRDWLLKYHSSQARSQYGDVYATFEVSAKTLEASNSQTNADAIELLGVLANLHYENVPVALFERSFASLKSAELQSEEAIEYDLRKLSKWHIARLPTIFHQGLSKSDFVLSIRNALCVLISSSLITITDDNQGSSISMHSLTHAWAKDRLTLPAQKVAWEAAGSIFALSISLIDEYSTIYWCLQPHAHAFVGYTKDYSSHDHTHVEIDRILVRVGTLFMYNGDHSTAVNLIRQVAVQYVPSQQSLRYIKMKIARCEISLGKYPSAVNGLKKIHEADKQALAVTHLDRVASQFELARAYMENGQHKKAAELLEEVVKIRKTTLDVTHPDCLASQHVLAGAYMGNGQHKKAAELLEEVVKIRKTTLDVTHPDCLASQHVLAGAYMGNGQHKKAAELRSQHTLAEAYMGNGQHKKAAELLEKVVEIRKTTLDVTHPDRLGSQHMLAYAYIVNGQYKKATELLEKVVEIRKTTLDVTHPDRLGSQYMLANAYMRNGQYKKAAELLEEIVEIQKKTLDVTHPFRLGSQHALANAYMENGQHKKAAELLEKVVEIRKTTLDATHPDRLGSQHELANAYMRNGQYKKAAELLEEVVKIRKKTLDVTHPHSLGSQHDLATAYLALGQYSEALKLATSVVEVQATLEDGPPNNFANNLLEKIQIAMEPPS
ncbi:hypothetical protein MMC22_007651 [Lobaria immixta]|nr:hypothetical protein [Lobaria immixta]